MPNLTPQQKAALMSYLRAMIASVGAVLATGSTDSEDILKAAIVAILPPVLRWANPKDRAFGRGA
jgi:hypothetical protein